MRSLEKDILQSEGKHVGEDKEWTTFWKVWPGAFEIMSTMCRSTKKKKINIVHHDAQHCLHHSLTGRGSSMSHCHSKTVQTLQHYVKPSLSAQCYIRNWIAKLCKVQYGWPGGFVLETTRPLVWKLVTNIQNEVKAGLASSMFIKDWEFFLLPSHK